MNRHELIDEATFSLASRAAIGRRYFARNVESPPVTDAVDETSLDLATLDTEGAQELTAATPAGDLQPEYLVYRWVDESAPTLIYHHGSGEYPFTFSRASFNSFYHLFGRADSDIRANLIVLRGVFHDRNPFGYLRAMGDLANFVGLMAASTELVEALTARLHAMGCPRVVVSGGSLGGLVTNLHRAHYGSAEAYAPLLAGCRLGEIFLTSAHRKLTSDAALDSAAQVRETLDFEADFTAAGGPECRPLLARHDRVIELDEQRTCYHGLPLRVIDKGHVTGFFATNALRRHVLRTLWDADGEEPAAPPVRG